MKWFWEWPAWDRRVFRPKPPALWDRPWRRLLRPGCFYTTATTEAAAESTQSTESTQSEDTQATNTNLSSSEAAAKEEIAQRESSGSYTAQNGQYYGRYQLASSYLNGDLSPENQEKVADNYVASRYGSWTAALAFWNANGWY